MKRKKPNPEIMTAAQFEEVGAALLDVYNKIKPVNQFHNNKQGYALKNALEVLLKRAKFIDLSKLFKSVKPAPIIEDKTKDEPIKKDESINLDKKIEVASVGSSEGSTQSTTDKKRRGRPKKVTVDA